MVRDTTLSAEEVRTSFWRMIHCRVVLGLTA
jgi:hypothetical protein